MNIMSFWKWMNDGRKEGKKKRERIQDKEKKKEKKQQIKVTRRKKIEK